MSSLFRNWLAHSLWSKRRDSTRFRWQRTAQFPSVLRADTIYEIGDDDCTWSAALRCPCGCGEMIHLSLVQDATPSWRILKAKSGLVTLLPSVWRTVGCKSHFIIYRGRIIWCMTISANGYQGADCEKATTFLEQALGSLTQKQRKPEWFRTVQRQSKQRVGT
jgi:hypothetical protein